jgi:hypothetical protein
VTETIHCRWCEERHRPRYLCNAAGKTLDALYQRGARGNMPELELSDPIPAEQLGLGLSPDDRLVSQLVVQAASVQAAGIPRPAVILTGVDPYGKQLPKWLYAGTDEDMNRLLGLITNMVRLAMRRAAEQRMRGERGEPGE